MEIVPLKVEGSCVYSDDALFEHIDRALALGLPEIGKQEDARPGGCVLVGSGPSVGGQIETIRGLKDLGCPVVAVRGAHDWLIANGVVPDFALNVDPLETAAECFARPHPATTYLIASQSHPKMFEVLAGSKVAVWHALMKKDQKTPKGRMLIGGSTTSGMRAVVVMHVLGWREFHLFGYDSCLSGDSLRIDGSGLKDGDRIVEVSIDPDGERFRCNPSMALQAQSFQDLYEQLPGVEFRAYGHGLIQAIVRKREAQAAELEILRGGAHPDNGRVSFIHSGGESMASYRYRAAMPAAWLGASINDFSASTLVFSKPRPQELETLGRAKAKGQWCVADFCDDHFDWPHCAEFLRLADAVACPTEAMRKLIADVPRYGRDASVVPESWEFAPHDPHCSGGNLLWFGSLSTVESLQRMRTRIGVHAYRLREVGNFAGARPWSAAAMIEELALADIVLIPATAAHKSANRAVEATMAGCLVVADAHPSLEGWPGIWIGDLKEGIEWATANPEQANARVSSARRCAMEKFSPAILSRMWRTAIERPTTSAAAESGGPDGSTSIPSMEPIFDAT